MSTQWLMRRERWVKIEGTTLCAGCAKPITDGICFQVGSGLINTDLKSYYCGECEVEPEMQERMDRRRGEVQKKPVVIPVVIKEHQLGS